MSDTRRGFFRSAAGLAAGAAGAAAADSGVRVPKARFGKVEISRMIVGGNPFLGFGHFNTILGTVMKEWFTQGRVIELLRRCEGFGLNAFNYIHLGRGQDDWEQYLAKGGKMHMIAQANTDDPAELVEAVKPMGAWVQGERTDDAYRAGRMDKIRDYAKKLRDLGVSMVGVGSHIPEVLELVEDQGWDVDFYAGCVYNRRRTREELRALLGGELPEMPSEVYLQDDPPRMYRFFRETRKPCVAFKILAAGRVGRPEAAFKLAFESIKPTDFVCVGLFPRIKDELKENVLYTSRYGAVVS
ncbi:MAG TPA: hypothetical protein VLH09_10285 [Bryobacteraceae bacterium]|nr:hypothetical protein [Bryobacteraceae bacterium]